MMTISYDQYQSEQVRLQVRLQVSRSVEISKTATVIK